MERPVSRRAQMPSTKEDSVSKLPLFHALSLAATLFRPKAEAEMDEETRDLQLLEEGLSPKAWKGTQEEDEAESFCVNSAPPEENKLAHEDEEDSECTRTDGGSYQGDSDIVSSNQDVEDFSCSESESDHSDVMEEDLLEVAPAIGTRVEVYFTDNSWVPATITHAKGLQAYVAWDGNLTDETMEELRDQSLLDFREDVVRLALAWERDASHGDGGQDAHHEESFGSSHGAGRTEGVLAN